MMPTIISCGLKLLITPAMLACIKKVAQFGGGHVYLGNLTDRLHVLTISVGLCLQAWLAKKVCPVPLHPIP